MTRFFDSLNRGFCIFMLAGSLFLASSGYSQEIKLGLQVGAVGSGDESKIGYGALFSVNPYGWAAFQVDFSLASFDAGTFFSASPGIIVYPLYHEEFQLGLIAGAGFYNKPLEDVKFGMHVGATGDFALTETFSTGMQARYHYLFGDSASAWTVFLTVSYRFEGDGGW